MDLHLLVPLASFNGLMFLLRGFKSESYLLFDALFFYFGTQPRGLGSMSDPSHEKKAALAGRGTKSVR